MDDSFIFICRVCKRLQETKESLKNCRCNGDCDIVCKLPKVTKQSSERTEPIGVQNRFESLSVEGLVVEEGDTQDNKDKTKVLSVGKSKVSGMTGIA